MSVNAAIDGDGVEPMVVEQVKRWLKIALGFTVLAAGIAMLVLPGPGWLVIAVALAMLAGEYVWARKLLNRLKDAGSRINEKVNPLKRRSNES
jgi:tellurite resistance protein TerC